MSDAVADVIDRLVGIAPASKLDAIRAQRQQARDNAQSSYLALFRPDDVSEMSLVERYAVAVFVAGLHGQADIVDFYAEGLAGAPGLLEALAREIAAGMARGPYGHYPPGPLSREDVDGPVYTVSNAVLGVRLSAAVCHAHLLLFHPRDAAPANLQALLDAGWSTTGIVTLSQLIAFLSFQIRVIVGLRRLAA
jgi:CMD domain protein